MAGAAALIALAEAVITLPTTLTPKQKADKCLSSLSDWATRRPEIFLLLPREILATVFSPLTVTQVNYGTRPDLLAAAAPRRAVVIDWANAIHVQSLVTAHAAVAAAIGGEASFLEGAISENRAAHWFFTNEYNTGYLDKDFFRYDGSLNARTLLRHLSGATEVQNLVGRPAYWFSLGARPWCRYLAVLPVDISAVSGTLTMERRREYEADPLRFLLAHKGDLSRAQDIRIAILNIQYLEEIRSRLETDDILRELRTSVFHSVGAGAKAAGHYLPKAALRSAVFYIVFHNLNMQDAELVAIAEGIADLAYGTMGGIRTETHPDSSKN